MQTHSSTSQAFICTLQVSNGTSFVAYSTYSPAPCFSPIVRPWLLQLAQNTRGVLAAVLRSAALPEAWLVGVLCSTDLQDLGRITACRQVLQVCALPLGSIVAPANNARPILQQAAAEC